MFKQVQGSKAPSAVPPISFYALQPLMYFQKYTPKDDIIPKTQEIYPKPEIISKSLKIYN